jgi:hypothetical protein
MPYFECGAQGLDLSRSLAGKLVSYHERIGLGFADDLTGQYANVMGLKKYVIVPSILQYANKKSSK